MGVSRATPVGSHWTRRSSVRSLASWAPDRPKWTRAPNGRSRTGRRPSWLRAQIILNSLILIFFVSLHYAREDGPTTTRERSQLRAARTGRNRDSGRERAGAREEKKTRNLKLDLTGRTRRPGSQCAGQRATKFLTMGPRPSATRAPSQANGPAPPKGLDRARRTIARKELKRVTMRRRPAAA